MLKKTRACQHGKIAIRKKMLLVQQDR